MKYNSSQTVNNPSDGKIPSACYKTQRNTPLTPGLRIHIQLIYITVHTYHPQGSEVIYSFRTIINLISKAVSSFQVITISGVPNRRLPSSVYNIWCSKQAFTFQ